MRAVTFEEYGEPAQVLHIRDVDARVPGPGEVRVRMLASPVNPSDLLAVRGAYTQMPPLPATPGFEGVGIVESSGGGLLGRFMVGRRVAVLARQGGAWAEEVVLPAKQVIPLPADLPLEQAAMFFVNPATAWAMCRRVLNVPPGAWLLQTAAGSALGRMVIRLGRHGRFHTLNVVRRAEQADELKALEADDVVVFDPQKDEPATLRETVLRHFEGKGVRYALDAVGGETGSAVAECLAENGRLLVYGTLSGEPLRIPPRLLIAQEASVEGFWLARWMLRQGLASRLRLVRTITRLMRAGVLVSPVGETFPLERVADAVRKSEEPGRGGKVLLRT